MKSIILKRTSAGSFNEKSQCLFYQITGKDIEVVADGMGEVELEIEVKSIKLEPLPF